jgi:hypothetical protein
VVQHILDPVALATMGREALLILAQEDRHTEVQADLYMMDLEAQLMMGLVVQHILDPVVLATMGLEVLVILDQEEGVCVLQFVDNNTCLNLFPQ